MGYRYRYNVSCSETYSKNWTRSAIDCYEIGCCCSKCFLYETYFKNGVHKCMMKNTVIELVRKFGAPQDNGED